ncbi:NUDIX hydrolase [Candidatus Protofrankia californiensis]|uniref:NUDIX hydrolase n=1 Tax=Candidatus Protofrankia californiensis TaxID=1839754 RepID=UPI001041714C|nr:NUDIX domain-containing protein [Candidatus Protofrankia californiensis]
MNVEGTDRRSVSGARTRQSTFTCMGASVEPPFEAVTSAAVVAVTANDLLVLAELDRGLDIPGGHVQRHERSIEETIRREAWEEVRVRVGDLRRVEVIESDYFGTHDLTYMVICAARVTQLAPWEAGHESAGRTVLPPEEFLRRYRGGDPELMRHLVTCALAVLDASSAPPPGSAPVSRADG